MPICRARDKWIYFAHVPKCAGTAVERYLEARFGPLGMHDGGFGLRSAQAAWSLSPPQHMPEAVRRDLLPDTLFDGVFATIRHPVTRLRSVFLFQRDVEKAVPARLPFHGWLDTVQRSLTLDPYALHGHLRPMTEYVPTGATVFRVEDGLGAVVTWLDDLTGTQGGPREVAPFNVLSERLGAEPENVALTPRILNQIAALYQADFDRFGYPADPEEMEQTT